VLGRPLDDLDEMLEVRASWRPQTVRLIANAHDVVAVALDGDSSRRTWMRAELQDVLRILAIPPAHGRGLSVLQRALDDAGSVGGSNGGRRHHERSR
jgi:hypothetical protein